MTKIMKVKLNTVPKEFKELQISTKKTYYFKEFDELLEMIKEFVVEKNKQYILDISIVDFDDPNNPSFELPDFKANKNMKTSILEIVTTEIMKDQNVDEKGVTNEYINNYKRALEESNNYDVAENKEVKTGKLKKASIFSKLKRKNKNKQEEAIELDDFEEIVEEGKDQIVGNTAVDNLYQEKEVLVVDLPDSQESEEDKNTDVNNIEENTKSFDALENDSVNHSGDQLNGDNEEQKQNIDNNVIESKNNEVEEVIKENNTKKLIEDTPEEINKQYLDKYDFDEKININDEKLAFESVTLGTSKEDKKLSELINIREQFKVNHINEDLEILENDLIIFCTEQEQLILAEINDYYNANKPSYDSYLESLIETERPLFDERIEKIEKQLDDQIEKILKADDEAYQLNRAIKQQQLINDKENNLTEERNKFKDIIEILRKRAIQKVDEDFDKEIKVFEKQKIESLKLSVVKYRAERLKELSAKLFKYDELTLAEVNKMKQQLSIEEEEREELEKQIEENKLKQQQLKLEEQKTLLEIKKSEEAIEKAKEIENKKILSENELKKALAIEESKKLDLELKAKEIEIRHLEAKEEENRLNDEDLKLRRKELENRKNEEDNISRIIKYGNITRLFPDSNSFPYSQLKSQTDEMNEVETAVEKKHLTPSDDVTNDNKKNRKTLVKTFGILALAGAIGIPTYVFADQNHLINPKEKTTEKSTEQVKKEKFNSYLKTKNYEKAYNINPEKEDEIKNTMLKNHDYVGAVKFAKNHDDKLFLTQIYSKNKNLDDFYKVYKNMSFEERAMIDKDTKEKMTKEYIQSKDYKKAELINKDLKSKKIKSQIDDLKEE